MDELSNNFIAQLSQNLSQNLPQKAKDKLVPLTSQKIKDDLEDFLTNPSIGVVILKHADELKQKRYNQ